MELISARSLGLFMTFELSEKVCQWKYISYLFLGNFFLNLSCLCITSAAYVMLTLRNVMNDSSRELTGKFTKYTKCIYKRLKKKGYQETTLFSLYTAQLQMFFCFMLSLYGGGTNNTHWTQQLVWNRRQGLGYCFNQTVRLSEKRAESLQATRKLGTSAHGTWKARRGNVGCNHRFSYKCR